MTEFKINVLSPETASKIAAGEVVEKPASVVKELVENAIDAKARSITIEIVNGGLDLIRIIDDGQGIRNADMVRAFLPHATSKIKKIDDIFDIMSLGFRGEALASVAAVSRTLLKSHSKEDQDGMEIFYEGGEEKFKKYSALDQGTIIDVRDLFYNVPARLKFLRTPQKEASNVTDILTRLALSRPDIAFTYYNNEKLSFRTYGTGKLVDVIRTVYNRKTAEHVTWFEREAEGVKVYGYIGNEEIARGSRNQQSLFINGRYITSRSLTVAVEQAFKSFITIKKFPFFVLFLDLAPNAVDVNVHPQKAEVKFSDDRLMFHTVFQTIHGVLRTMYQGDLGFEEGLISEPAGGGLTPNGSNTGLGEERELSTQFTQGSMLEDATPIAPPGDGFSNGRGADRGNLSPKSSETSSETFSEGPLGVYSKTHFGTYPKTKYGTDAGSNDGTTQAGEAANAKTENSSVENTAGESYLREEASQTQSTFSIDSANEVRLPVDLKLNRGTPGQGEMEGNSVGHAWRKADLGGSRQTAASPPSTLSPEEKFPMPRIMGQYHKTYILAELNGALYLIDQHAAHEKINFERYMDEMLHRELVIQPLLVPQVLDLAVDDYSVYLENEEVFKGAGFTIEEFGERSLNLREVPYFLSHTNAEVYFKAIIDNLKNLGKGSSKEVRYLRIATAACKASVRANDELTMAEMEHLIDDLRFLKEPFTCPHGRPTMIRFTLTEVEKMFRRIQ